MRLASPFAVAAGVLLAGLFVVRAATGVPAAWSYREGKRLEDEERFTEAWPLLDRAAVGGLRAEVLGRAGRSRVDLWYTLHAPVRMGPQGDEMLRVALSRFLAERADSPAAAWTSVEIGRVYECRASNARARGPDLAELERGPWALLGDDGRIAIGLIRAAIAREPNTFEIRDHLVLVLEDNGLHEEAKAAMVESARVLPDFGLHLAFQLILPRDLVEAFWQASRALDPADVPLQSRERHLLSLGQLGRRLGHLAEAEHDLRAALAAPGTRLAGAEDAFHLAQVLVDQGRFDEAETLLARALREPVFVPGVVETRARIAIKRERWAEALEQLKAQRRIQPRDLEVLLSFARVAQKTKAWDQAEESLRWAIVVHPEEPAPRVALVEMFLALGDRAAARRQLDDYVVAFGPTGDSVRLAQILDPPLDRAGR